MGKEYEDSELFVLKVLSDLPYRPRIVNRQLVPIILTLVEKCPTSLQSFVISLFLMLVDKCAPIINIATSASPDCRLLDILLEQFPSYQHDIQVKATHLLEIYGKYSISVSQLKKMFRMLLIKGGTSHVLLILRSLKTIITGVREPKQFFILEGIDSGLQLPTLQRWS